MPTQRSATSAPAAPKPTVSAANDGGGNKPVQTFRHRSLKATIWRNDTDKGSFYNVTIVRAYRDENGDWQDTHSFGYDDLMNVSSLMYQAHAFISGLRAEEGTRSRSTSVK